MALKFDADYPRILVISNNSFSDTTNNGKTLASFFDKFPAQNIAQLYFNPETPNNSSFTNYFRITDIELVKATLKRTESCGLKLETESYLLDEQSSKETGSIATKIKDYNIARIAREVFWKSGKWKTEVLNQWLNDFSPEIIFFCAGDSGFAYDITKFIKEQYNTKLVVYITDDYILPRKTVSPFWWGRRNFILNKMRNIIKQSDLFLTISEQMRKEYKELFGKESILAVNMTETLKDKSVSTVKNEKITLVYTGGLHYKRYVTLNLLAKAIKNYNDNAQNNRKAYLKIYTGQTLTKKLSKLLNIEGASKYSGYLSPIQLKEVLNSCDIPVHVESFNKKSIESTRLSISTKIPEYLSLGKPVIAIGPSQVASIEYLKDAAFCISNKDNIDFELERILNDEILQGELSNKTLLMFEANHKKEMVSTKLYQEFMKLYK